MNYKIFLWLLLLTFSQHSFAVEVLHWWTSKSEVNALAVVKNALTTNDIVWSEYPVPGGGGDTAMVVLQARVITGNPPNLAQIEGRYIHTLAKYDFLLPLDKIFKQYGWEKLLPEIAVKSNTYNGIFIAVPINIHRVNWMWSNNRIFKSVGIEPPTSWKAFFEVADILKARGITPLAIGNDKWQLAILFENMVLGIGGDDFFRSFLIEMDESSIDSPLARQILEDFKRLRSYLGPDLPNMSWDKVTEQLTSDQAAMQIIGDWAKSEILGTDRNAIKNVTCSPAPGTSNSFIYNMDSFVFFKNSDLDIDQIEVIVNTFMDASFQVDFNQLKGSIPIRHDVSVSHFDSCAQRSKAQFLLAESKQLLLPSVTDSMAIEPQRQQALLDLLYRYFNDAGLATDEVVTQLLKIANMQH